MFAHPSDVPLKMAAHEQEEEQDAAGPSRGAPCADDDSDDPIEAGSESDGAHEVQPKKKRAKK